MSIRIIVRSQCDVVVKILMLPTRMFLVNRVYRIISSQLSTLQAIGYSICIQAPKNTLLFCFEVQKEIVCFPFRCVRKAFDTMTFLLRRLRGGESKPLSAAQLLTGTTDPTLEQVRAATKDIRSAAINTIVNQTTAKSRLLQYREELERWAMENDKKIEDSFAFSADDKEVLKSLAHSLKHLKTLKARKEKLNSAFYVNVNKIFSKDNFTADELRLIQKNHKNMTAINSEMEEKKNDCLNVINGSSKLSQLFTKIVLQSEPFSDGVVPVCDSEIPYGVPNKIQSVLSKSKYENTTLKNNLAGTNEKLEEILHVTESIRKVLLELSDQLREIPRLNSELSMLRQKLEEEQKTLKDVQEERNNMKEKLEILSLLIEHEECFLDGRAMDSNCDKDLEDFLINTPRYCTSSENIETGFCSSL